MTFLARGEKYRSSSYDWYSFELDFSRDKAEIVPRGFDKTNKFKGDLRTSRPPVFNYQIV